MRLTSESKILLGILGSTIFIIVLAVFFMSQPAKPLPRAELAPPTAPSAGPKDAPNYLVEFSDFQCPACREFSKTVDQLIAKYPQQLLVVYRYYPLPQHPQAVPAAMVAESARQQGKFWEMGNLLFENQESLSESTYASLSAQLQLDWTKIKKDLDTHAYKSLIDSDVAYGEKIGVNATPTFYLNGVKLNLNVPGDLTNAVAQSVK